MLSGQMENVEVEIVRRVYASGAFLSLLGSCFIIITFLLNRKLRTTTTFLVFLLAVASLGHALFVSLSWFLYDGMFPFTKDISDGVKEILCVIQASGISSYFVSYKRDSILCSLFIPMDFHSCFSCIQHSLSKET